MPENNQDVTVIRELALQYAELASDAVQEERRELWRKKNSLERCRPLVHVRFRAWRAIRDAWHAGPESLARKPSVCEGVIGGRRRKETRVHGYA